MALIYKVDPNIITNSECTELAVNDGTGVYDAGTNPGGFGAPNPVRGERALYLQSISYNNDSSVKLQEIVLSTVDPLTVASWVYPTVIDGYFNFKIIGVNAWEVAVAYMAGDIVYFVGSSAATTGLYKAVQNSMGVDPDSDPLFWGLTSSSTLLTADIDNITPVDDSELENYFQQCNSENCYSKATVELTNDLIANVCGSNTTDSNNWKKLHTIYSGMLVLLDQQRFLEAQEVAEYLAALCLELNCDCEC